MQRLARGITTALILALAVQASSSAFAQAAAPAETQNIAATAAGTQRNAPASAPASASAPALAADAEAAHPAPVAVFRLQGALQERPAGFSFSMFTGSDEGAPALSDLIVRLRKAASDNELQGVLLDVRGLSLTMSQAQELGELIKNLRAAHKRVIVYNDEYDTATYLLASYADTVLMPENGEMLMPGPQISMIFIKGLLDKIHVQADLVQIGKYKGAREPMTLTQASPEFKEQIDKLVDALYTQLTTTLAANRGLAVNQAVAAIDEAWISADRAKALGLVDHLMTRTQANTWLDEQFPHGATVVDDYGLPKKRDVDFNNPFAIFSLLSEPPAKPRNNDPAIAVVYANGEINGDQPAGASSDQGVTPEGMRKALNKALADRRVKAIVLRVDSPGGSATASDAIWQLLRDADKKKPVTVSMGHMAASGGYYISTAGREINAEAATIAGSIGVVGGKVVIKGLLDTIGVNVETVSRGKRAGMLSPFAAFTPEERDFIGSQMNDTYQLFLKRVKTSRGAKIKSIDDVAQGRIFSGNAAVQAGLVDKIASLADTISAAAKDAGLGQKYQVLTYPEPRTLSDILRQGLQVDARLPIEFRTALSAVPASYRQETLRLLGLVEALRSERVMLALPAGIVEE